MYLGSPAAAHTAAVVAPHYRGAGSVGADRSDNPSQWRSLLRRAATPSAGARVPTRRTALLLTVLTGAGRVVQDVNSSQITLGRGVRVTGPSHCYLAVPLFGLALAGRHRRREPHSGQGEGALRDLCHRASPNLKPTGGAIISRSPGLRATFSQVTRPRSAAPLRAAWASRHPTARDGRRHGRRACPTSSPRRGASTRVPPAAGSSPGPPDAAETAGSP